MEDRYTVLRLTPSVKEFLEKILFPKIPQEAQGVIFDRVTGDAQFVETIIAGRVGVPQIVMVTYYSAYDVVIEDDRTGEEWSKF